LLTQAKDVLAQMYYLFYKLMFSMMYSGIKFNYSINIKQQII